MTAWPDATGTLELRDSTGPVSPRYQLDREVDVEVMRDGAIVRRRVRRGGGEVEQTEIRLDPAGRRALLDALLDAGLTRLVPRKLGDAERARIGVSFNHLAWSLGGVSGRVEYLPTYLRSDEAGTLRDVLHVLTRE